MPANVGNNTDTRSEYLILAFRGNIGYANVPVLFKISYCLYKMIPSP